MPFILTDERVIQPVTTGDITLAFRRFEGDERDRFDKAFSRIVGGPKKHFAASLEALFAEVATELCVWWAGPVDQSGKPVGTPYAAEAGVATVDEEGHPIAAYVPTQAQALAFFRHRESQPYWWSYINDYVWPKRKRKASERGPQVNEPDDVEAVTPGFLSSK